MTLQRNLETKVCSDLPLIFLDTSTLKFASERIVRGIERPVTLKWGDKVVKENVTQFVEIYPNEKVNDVLKNELIRLPFLAYLESKKLIRLTTHREVLFEFYGLPKTDDARGLFYGATIEQSPDPFYYSRVIAGMGFGFEDSQFDFVSNLADERFQQLKLAVGANEQSKKYRNQLLDAFHILCAERSDCDYFLTLDLKLIRHINSHSRYPPELKITAPIDLVNDLLSNKHIRFRDALKYAWRRWRDKDKRPSGGVQDLVNLGRKLEKEGYYDS